MTSLRERGETVPCHRRPTGSSWFGCSGKGTGHAPPEEACGSSAPSARCRKGEGGCLSVLKKDGFGLGVLKKKTYSHWYFA